MSQDENQDQGDGVVDDRPVVFALSEGPTSLRY